MSVLSQNTANVLERVKKGGQPPERIPRSERLSKITAPTLVADCHLKGRRVYRNGFYTGELAGLVVHSAIPQGRGRFNWNHGDAYEGNWKTVCRPATGFTLDGKEVSLEAMAAAEALANGEDAAAGEDGAVAPPAEAGLTSQQQTSRSQTALSVARDAGAEEGEGESGPVEITPLLLSTYSPFYRDESTRPHGEGKYEWATGESYEGEYKDGNRNGVGTYTWPNGDTYTGQWRKGKMHGKGVYKYGQTGDEFEGQYVWGSREGPGVHTMQARAAKEDGTPATPATIYTGMWTKNKKEGVFKAKNIETGVEEDRTFVAGVDSAAPKPGGKKK